MNSYENVIVVGVDDSPESRAAIRWAAEHARATGCRLQAVHVLAWPPATEQFAYSVMADEVFPDPAYVEERYREPSQAIFDEVDPAPDWQLQFAQGHAGRILVEVSRSARLLVVGAREHRGIGRLLNGSVGHFCLNHATCPVVSVPANGAAAIASVHVAEPAAQLD
jgi:nucleotide-binding universal stress UspA family protein